MEEEAQQSRRDKFQEGVIWNFGSVVVLAISGFALNVLIGAVYDAAALGVFNQALGIYTFFAMFAVGGVNLSALKRIADSPNNLEQNREIAFSAFVLTLICAALTTSVFLMLRAGIAGWLASEGVLHALTWIAPGLFFFALNKTLLGIVNGLHHMRAFAMLQSLRYFNLLVGFLLAYSMNLPGDRLAGVFSFSEAIVFLCTSIYLREYLAPLPVSRWSKWTTGHAAFGVKAMLSGALLELNSRIDVLLLGYFHSDSVTGIYSFAAMVFEGLMQFFVVLQSNYNPALSRLFYLNDLSGLEKTIKAGRNKIYKGALLAIPLAIVGYPIGVKIVFFNNPEFAASWLPFAILMGCMLIAAGYIPFQGLLVMAGQPAWHTTFMLVTVVSNALLNWLLIPRLGVAGAALGMGLCLLIANLTLILLVKYRLKISFI
jgi:stage V sporulation protein B